MSIWGDIKGGVSKVGGFIDDKLSGNQRNEFRSVDPNGNISGQAGQASGFANLTQEDFMRRGARMDGVANRLDALSRGENSISAEQLRQGLQQQLASQQANAASARPGNSAMAARTAAIQGGRAQSGMAGQQAMAGIAERNAATNALGGLMGQMRAQDLQAALQSRGQALGGYGTLEQARSNRFGALVGQPTTTDKLLAFGQGIASKAALGGAG